MMDYIKIGVSRTGFTYALMMVDKFSRFVWFMPCKSATAIVAARSVLQPVVIADGLARVVVQ